MDVCVLNDGVYLDTYSHLVIFILPLFIYLYLYLLFFLLILLLLIAVTGLKSSDFEGDDLHDSKIVMQVSTENK